MRGTTKITNENNIHYLRRNWQSFNKVQQRISSYRQVVDIEDDPLASVIGISMTTLIARTEQYTRNINTTGKHLLGLTDQSLASSYNTLKSVNSLVIGAANDPTGDDGRQANLYEVEAILKQLVSEANAYDGGRYLYGGTYTKSPPFQTVNGRYVNYLGDDKDISIQIGHNSTEAVNCTGTAAFGNMETVISGRDMNPDVNLSTDNSTRLADLNGGQGIPKGKITVYYSAYPDGLEVDLSGCDTLEDVKDTIEKQTLDASRKLNTAECKWLDSSNLNWRDLQDRYVKVTMNPEHNGISLQEFDLGEPLPAPDKYERHYGLDYAGDVGYPSGGGGYGAGVPGGETTVYDKSDFIYGDGSERFAPIRVADVANSKVAEGLGIKGSANTFSGDPVLDGFLHGRDLNPKLSERTLLADLEGYNNSVYTFNNGAKPGEITVSETSTDANNVFSSWQLTGLNKTVNTGAEGELYARVTRRDPPQNDIFVELYTKPIDKAKPADLVATGSYTQSDAGGTVILDEANSSGLGGTVGIVLPTGNKDSRVNLKVDFGTNIQSSVYVPAFIEEQNSDGSSKDVFDIASGWDIRGLDKPPATGYDLNHPASTDMDGNVGVNYRYENDKLVVELYRPAFADQPAALIATGSMDISAAAVDPVSGATTHAVSGRVELVGAPGFEQIKGSVYMELPVGASFIDNNIQGNGSASPTQTTYQLASDAPAGTLVLGGAMELTADAAVGAPYRLTADTMFKAGQVFDADVIMPNGAVLKAGTKLVNDYMIPKGVEVRTDTLLTGTVLPERQTIVFPDAIPAGTVIPSGTYYAEPAAAFFPAANMGIQVDNPGSAGLPARVSNPAGYNLKATFATIEDFNRAVAESGAYVKSSVAADGRSMQFTSSLAGAYLTVSEDTDCYEQMNDKYQQLSALNLDGLVKGENTDTYGNVYTEVIYYPPNNPPNPDHPKVTLVGADGKTMDIDPGYYVRVYSDKGALDQPFEDRDNSSLVAEGFIPAGEWSDAWLQALNNELPITSIDDPDILPLLDDQLFTPPGADPIGMATGLVLEERNDSGVRGTVNVDYYGNRKDVKAEIRTRINTATNQEEFYIEYDPWKNDEITVFPGGLRPEGSRHTTIQQWDLTAVEPGVTCDYGGTVHGVIARDDATVSDVNVTLYRDASHTIATARNNPDDPIGSDGLVRLYYTNPDGSFPLDSGVPPQPILVEAGTMVVAANNLSYGASDNFTLTTGAARSSGQEREENVWSTINDIIDALAANDSARLHDLVGTTQADMDRLYGAQASVASRSQRLELVLNRHADEMLNYGARFNSTVGMDNDSLQTAILQEYSTKNAYEAAMQAAADSMNLSLLDYLR